jgi:shikimate kinase
MDIAPEPRRVFITGMSGTGKSTVIRSLQELGHRAVDFDTPEWSEHRLVDGERDWVWREDRVAALLQSHRDGALFVSGCAINQRLFYPQLDEIVLLSAPWQVLKDRLETRTTNTYGKTPEEIALIQHHIATVEPLLRRIATFEVDTAAPLDDVVKIVLRLTGVESRA